MPVATVDSAMLRKCVAEKGFSDTPIATAESMQEIVDYSVRSSVHPRIVYFRPDTKSAAAMCDRLCEIIGEVAAKLNKSCDFEVVVVGRWSLPSKAQQCQFTLSCLSATAVIVDATIPELASTATVYPILTPLVNSLGHVLVVSRTTLPLNITTEHRFPRFMEFSDKGEFVSTPQKTFLDVWNEHGREDLEKMFRDSLLDVIGQNDLACVRMPPQWFRLDMGRAKLMMELLMAINERPVIAGTKKRVFLSYRSGCKEEVRKFKEEQEKSGEVNIYLIEPQKSKAEIDESHESMTPFWQWMFMGITGDLMRTCDEVWIYCTDGYDDAGNYKSKFDCLASWWTMMEWVKVKFINLQRSEKSEKKAYGERLIQMRVYDPKKKAFRNFDDYIKLQLSDDNQVRLARLMSNTRLDTMGPEAKGDILKMSRLLSFLGLLRLRKWYVNALKRLGSQWLSSLHPTDMPEDDRKNMVDAIFELYADDEKMKQYAEDEVFQEWFWNDVADRDDLSLKHEAVNGDKNGVKEINVDVLLAWPRKMRMQFGKHSDKELVRKCAQGRRTCKITTKKGIDKLISIKDTMYVWHCRKHLFPPKPWSRSLARFHKFALFEV